jgi:hypothetical protein
MVHVRSLLTTKALLTTVRLGIAIALLALVAGASPATDPARDRAAPDRSTPIETLPDDDGEARRKAEVLAGSRWRRAMHELDQWLAAQPVYSPRRVEVIKAELTARVAAMTSYELEYMLDGLDKKLAVLESQEAQEAREWLGRYLSVMADDRRAALLADVPNVLDLTAEELAAKLVEVEKKRAQVERSARDSRRSRRDFATFVGDARRAETADRDRLGRIRRGDAAFSPYRTQPAGSPPFPDTFDSPTVVGVGPWGSFSDVSFVAF